MSLSLVAYDNSDEDSENEENESASTIIASKADDKTIEAVTVQIDKKLLLSAPEAISHGTNDKEEEVEESNDTKDFKNFFTVLPKPKSFESTENIEENDDILLKRETKYQATKPAKKRTIKITVPSLSEFKDIEEENEEKPTRIVQPSQKGCGLFALLVPPKTDIVKNKILIPQTVKNAAAKTKVQQTNVSVEASRSQKNNLKTRKSTIDKSQNEFSDDEENAAMDFFGLTASKNTLDDSTVESLDSNIEKTPFVEHTEDRLQSSSSSNLSVLMSDELDNSSKTLTSNVMNLPKEEILLKNKAEVGPKLPVPEQEYNVDMEGNIAFDEKAIEYLCGKRGVKRKDMEIDEANIIEINGEDIKPDEREWLVKALTEEPIQRPISMQSCGINSQSKKKHQITYLAHQAKAMELELKNQWSQNRMTRKQTKSKYGF